MHRKFVDALDLPKSATVMQHRSDSWASLTFIGEKHTVKVQFASCEQGAKFVDAFDDWAEEVKIPGYLVADVNITSQTYDRILNHATVDFTVLLLQED